MRHASLALTLAALLAACGADGEPTPPASKEAPRSGVSVSGQARIGVAVSRGRLVAPAPGY